MVVIEIIIQEYNNCNYHQNKNYSTNNNKYKVGDDKFDYEDAD